MNAHALSDFDHLWDYNKPAETEVKFRALLSEAENSGDAEYPLQLLTQIARTLSLQRKFAEAHALLDGVASRLGSDTPVAEVRYMLERGRTFNSSKMKAEAMPLFARAFELGEARRLDFHAVDAAHMLAIAHPDPHAQMEWNLRALAIAEQSRDGRAQSWRGSLYNNIGWTFHDQGRYQEALDVFQKAVAFREQEGKAYEIHVAKWAVARALRSLKRYEEALVIQRALEEKNAAGPDGYVFEEIAELLLALGEDGEKYFAKAYDLLSQDDWFRENEAARLERLRTLGKR